MVRLSEENNNMSFQSEKLLFNYFLDLHNIIKVELFTFDNSEMDKVCTVHGVPDALNTPVARFASTPVSQDNTSCLSSSNSWLYQAPFKLKLDLYRGPSFDLCKSLID